MSKKRVLLVDDVAPLRLFVAMSIDRSGDFEVTGQAADANEALEQVAAADFDVIILDVNMPGRTGLDILPELRSKLPDAVIIVFSGFESSAIAEKAKKLGADAYVEKGTSSKKLLEVMRDLGAEPRPR